MVNPFIFVDWGENNADTNFAIDFDTPDLVSEFPSFENEGLINFVDDLNLFIPPSTPNGSFQYPGGSTIIPLAHAQTEPELRQLYKALFKQMFGSGNVEVVMDPFTYDGVEYPAGTMATMGGFSGPFNTTAAKEPFNITKAYSLDPRKIAVFRSEITDSYGQHISWEEGYFERIFRVYLWGDYFTTINETDIWNDMLKMEDYDMLIIPSVIKGYETSVVDKLGSKGLAKIRQFSNHGGTIYAQGGMCHVAEAAWVVPNGTVLMNKRIDATNNHADMVAVNTSSIMAMNWLSNRMYLIDDPVLNVTENATVVAKYTGNLTNSSLINTSAILSFKHGNGKVLLTNGHPSVKGEFYPIVLSAVMESMTETSDLRATARQIYTDEVPANLIPAQEPDIPVEVNITYVNFWPVSGQRTVNVTETITPLFYLDNTTVVPDPYYILNHSTNETDISWEFKDHQGIENFQFIAKTYPNTTKKGHVTVSCGQAKYTPPGYRGRTEIYHGCTSINAALAARLVGDRDIELDGCYPLPADGFYYDIAMPLENKEETTAKNITITDIVILKSPIVDVDNQTRVPDAWNNTNNGTGNPVFAVNEIFYYYDKYGKPLYPMPDEIHNTTYNYTFGNNGTNLTLPAKKLVWYYPNIIPYDYQEPAIRYGIFTQEEHKRTVSFLSSPMKNSVILNASGGSVFTNLGIHPIPYHEYLAHGVITIPKGDEIPRVDYKDIWNRNHTMELRTVFYDIVPFPPPEEHAVVTTTYEMTKDGERFLEFPIHHKMELNFTIKTWNGYGIYNATSYPYHMDLHKNETMIVQALPRGVGYNIDYIESIFDDNTTLLMIENTSTHTILYFQQYIEGGHKETINVKANLSGYPQVHREGAMKINDGARFVYHQIAVGPSRYEVFDSHVQAVFGIGNDVQVDKRVAPVYIATFGDDVYHFIEIEDPYEPREFMQDPYIKSYGFGDMAATTYVGGRINDSIHSSRVEPGDRTLIRLEVQNNLGYDLNNVTVTPVAPPGFTITPDTFTTQVPPIFYDFPFINRSDIWDAWKSVYYWWVDVDKSVVGGEVYQIDFTFESNCSNASYLPADFEIPPALIGVKDPSGHVSAIFGRATDLKLMDAVPSYVNPEYVAIANVAEKDLFELDIAVGVSNPGTYNRSEINNTYQYFRPVNFTHTDGDVDIQLPPYAQVMPWLDNGTDAKTMFVLVKTNVSVNRGGTYTVNEGPSVSYVNHFNETVNVSGPGEYIEAHGPAFNYFMSVMQIEANSVKHNYLTREENNTVLTKVDVFNYGDGIAESSVIQVQFSSTSILDASKLPTDAFSSGNIVYWTTGDIGPGSKKSIYLTFFTTPPADTSSGPNRGPPEPWLMIDHSKVKFMHGFLKKSVTVPPSGPLYAQFFGIDMDLERISFSHPFAAINEPHMLYAEVSSHWPYTEPMSNVKVNFSIDSVFVGQGTIAALQPGALALAGLGHTFTKEGTYGIKAEIVSPTLNEFYDHNNDFETTITVVNPVSVTSQPDHGTGIDAFIASGDGTVNFENSESLKVGRFSSAGGAGSGIGYTRSLVNIDVSGLPSNAMVLDAKLSLYMHSSTGGTLPITAYNVGRGWGESSVTWDTRPYEYPDVLDMVNVDTTAGYKTWNITSVVSDWAASPLSNHGIMLISDHETMYLNKEFYSSDAENDLKPVLYVRYAMLKNTPDISMAEPRIGDYKEKELRIEWTPVPSALYYEIYKSSSETGPFTKLGTTWTHAAQGYNGSLNTFFYDDLDGGYPDAPTVIATDRGNQPGTIRVYWTAPDDPDPSTAYYYRVKAFGVEGKESVMTDPLIGQLTPTIVNYYIYNSTLPSGPWTKVLGETADTEFNHANLGTGKVMYYRIMSESSEGYQSPLSKVVWGRSNRLPLVSSGYITPDPATTINHLYARFTFSDPDGDTEAGSTVRWYRDGNLVSTFNDYKYVHYWYTAKGEVWYFVMTAKDGIEYGNSITSSMIAIQNSPPRLTSVYLSPGSPKTTDALTLNYKYSDYDKDTEALTQIEWYRDGMHQGAHDGKKVLPASATSKGEVWNASIRASDGTDYCDRVDPLSRKIINTAPVVNDVKIMPDGSSTDDALTASYKFVDADTDSESGTVIYWWKFNVLQTIYINKKTVPSSATVKGDEWYFTITPHDGEHAGVEVTSPMVKIGNAEPVVTEMKIYPAAPRTGDDLTLWYKYTDPDGDAESGSVIKWYRNDKHVSSLENKLKVPSTETARGDSWQFTITPKDGFDFGTAYYSDTMIILNSKPIIQNAEIIPGEPALSDDLLVTYDFTDDDGDDVSEAVVKWYKNGEEQNAYGNLLMIPADDTSPGDIWRFELSINDGFDFSDVFISEEVTINTPPQALNPIILPSLPTSSDALSANYLWKDSDLYDDELDTEIMWYRNGLVVDALVGESEVPSVMTSKGEQWFFTVTPCDGKDLGDTAPSPPVEIANSPPVASELTITPWEPTPDADMKAGYTYTDADGDEESGTTVQWYRNNEAVDEFADELVVPQDMLAAGDIWYFTVQPGDGDGFGKTASSDVVTIGKPAVAVTMAVINPALPLTTDELTAYIELSEQKDGYTFEYRWFKNDELQSALNDLDSIDAKFTSKGETWYYTIRVYTGTSWTNAFVSSTVIIGNSIPLAEDVSISPQSPISSMELTVKYTFIDADLDTESLTEIRWYRNGEGVRALNDQIRVPVDYLLPGDEWFVTVEPSDFGASGLMVTSKTVMINIPPTARDLELFPANPEPNEPLTLYYSYFDENNDIEALTSIAWYRNGVSVPEYDDWKAVPADATAEGEEWYTIVTPHDGKEYGFEYESNTVTVSSPQVSEGVQDVKVDAGPSFMTLLSIMLIILICVFIIMFLIVRRSKILRSTTKGSVDQIFTIDDAESLSEERGAKNEVRELYAAEPVLTRDYFAEVVPQAPRYVGAEYISGIEGADPCAGCDSETYGDLERCANCFNEIDELVIEDD